MNTELYDQIIKQLVKEDNKYSTLELLFLVDLHLSTMLADTDVSNIELLHKGADAFKFSNTLLTPYYIDPSSLHKDKEAPCFLNERVDNALSKSITYITKIAVKKLEVYEQRDFLGMYTLYIKLLRESLA